MSTANAILSLGDGQVLGGLTSPAEPSPLPGGRCFLADNVGDGLAWQLAAGTLTAEGYICFDMLLDGRDLAVFCLTLSMGEGGPAFTATFGLLNQCSSRVRLPLRATDQARWSLGREGGWLKVLCGGDRVEPARVDRITLTVLRKSSRPVRWWQTPVTVTGREPPRLAEPLLPAGPLIDSLGQSTLHDWPSKSRSPREVTDRLRRQLADADAWRWPETFSRWGGWKDRRFEASGFFRMHHDGRRWWLVDPDGHAFWSAGMDCVRPSVSANFDGVQSALTWLKEFDGPWSFLIRRTAGGVEADYLRANLVRAFGADPHGQAWSRIALGMLRQWGFNTVANWSDWEVARAAGFPYVRPLSPSFPRAGTVFRGFPDVFAPGFPDDAAAFAEQLRDSLGDPAMIGYFLMNEPSWGFARQTPAEGLLHHAPACPAREALAGWLRGRYGTEEALSAAWGTGVTFAALTAGPWREPLAPRARTDMEAFSAVMVERFFRTLSEACRAVDPRHLNLGMRYYTVPPDWALGGMDCFDVFSINCYREKPPAGELTGLSERLGVPVMIGEWHFGSLDVGLPGSGIGHVRDQQARGQAFRVYQEAAAALPCCVGAHYFTLYDESALGRFDGENWNIGFLDIGHRIYEPLADATRQSHEQIYNVAAGLTPAFDQAPEYLPRLFN